MQSYIEMSGGKKVAIQNEKTGTYRLVDARSGRPVMCGFKTVKEAIHWTKINWN